MSIKVILSENVKPKDTMTKVNSKKRALITGVAGQDGAYLSRLLLEKGYTVFGMDRSDIEMDKGNLAFLGIDKEIQYCSFNLLDYSDICNALNTIKPAEIYNLAGLSSVSMSFREPILTAESNGLSTLKILEAIRHTDPAIRFYQASSSELFGKTDISPQNEKTPFYPRSPYASAKLFAHCSTINYREAYNLFACAGIMYNHESPLRGLAFVTRKITNSMVKIKNGFQAKLYLGNLSAKRDWGYAEDYVKAMWLMLQQREPDDFVIATGKMHNIRDFVEASANCVGIGIEWSGAGVDEKGVNKLTGETLIEVSPEFFRPTDVDNSVGDASKAAEKLNWRTKVSFEEMVEIMVKEDIKALIGN